MDFTFNLLGLPGEVREKIYRHYFQVDGGYAHDAESDKLKTADGHPIDLSLLYTCRTIACEARDLPLSVNDITFTTLYRPELNNLAGCSNLVSSTYQLLEADLLLLIGIDGAISPEIHSQLAIEFPEFETRLAFSLRPYKHMNRSLADLFNQTPGDRMHRYMVYLGSEPEINDCSAASLEIEQLRSTMGRLTGKALYRNANILGLTSSGYYRGFSRINGIYHRASSDLNWSKSFWEAERTLSSALVLLARDKPAEFRNQIYANFPQWVGSYPAHEFLNLRFEHWTIPSSAKVKHAMKLLAIGDFWHFPGMWHEARACCKSDDGEMDGEFEHQYGQINYHVHNPVASSVRSREKIRFSAVANAIRFLETRLNPEQRRAIRNIILHEDLPSVNQPSAHAQGLAPFYRDNPHLRVERRVDLMGCVFPALASPCHVANRFKSPDACPNEPQLSGRKLRLRISQWLLDALAVTKVGIPAEAFTLVLQAGSYEDYFTNQFQQHIHKEIAWHRAFKTLNPGFPFSWPRNDDSWPIQISMIDKNEIDAIESLMKGTSPILRSDFNTGVEWEFDTIVSETRHLDMEEWMVARNKAMSKKIEQPTHPLDYITRLLENFEIQMD
ncbi:hypothetical protein NXS19_011041 [Fusarium pseudograminearum]|nr:hypothetical protein NXS19_011041 [Fusarium pseudograminearum]